ncbi:MAG: hypothetical protein ABI658_19210, partial [Acidimicrobiales bacterium]
ALARRQGGDGHRGALETDRPRRLVTGVPRCANAFAISNARKRPNDLFQDDPVTKCAVAGLGDFDEEAGAIGSFNLPRLVNSQPVVHDAAEQVALSATVVAR